MQLPRHVFVRAPSPAYADCLRREDAVIDLPAAARQHAGYVAGLRRLGVPITALPPLEEAPDATFLEDVAVVLDDRALITIPGAASRRGEPASVQSALSGELEVEAMYSGTLDGGDVLRVGDTWFVGRSARTDADGIASLTRFVPGEVVEVPVRDGLHLKSGATALDPETVLIDASTLDPAPFQERGISTLPAPEPSGANVLPLGPEVWVSASAPSTAALLTARGHRVRVLPMSAFHAGDGALTCLSLRVPPAGGWCA
ncbi:MAG: dimethylarginine dimethylaminohydrolase family protein [Sandaracinaceae bacterium]